MAEISKITLPSGTTYDLKDATARSEIETLKSTTTGAMTYLGTTTTALTDGATTNPITIGTASVTAEAGDVAIYGDLEFVYSETDGAWHEFGSTGSLKALAFKDTASATYKPAGTVSKAAFTGTKATISGTSADTFATDVTLGIADTTATETAGDNQTKFLEDLTYDKNGSAITGSTATISSTYTPEGTVSTPTVTVTPNTTTVNSITAVGTLPSVTTAPKMTATVSNETLTLGWTDLVFSAGTLPTKGANTTVMTGATATASQPTFTGTEGTATASYTPTIPASATGGKFVSDIHPTQKMATISAAKSAVSTSAEYTPAGTIGSQTFTGTESTIEVS